MILYALKLIQFQHLNHKVVVVTLVGVVDQ